MLATTRSRRSNAGAQMAKLLEDLQEDEFYKSTYGGFEESDEDNDFKSGDEKEVEDDVDSDFSIEEKDEPISDHEDEGPKRQKKIDTKAYKEPKPAPQPGTAEKKPRLMKPRKPKMTADMYERKSIRKSTVKKSEETQLRVKKRKEAGPRKHRRHRDYFYEPTQEEKLAEARLTEQENLKSLEKYQKMELEKKKTRGSKKNIVGPTIRYHSVAMPLIEELPNSDGPSNEEKINVEDTVDDVPTPETVTDVVPSKETDDKDKAEKAGEQSSEPASVKVLPRVERTFLTFSDESSFRKAYRLRKRKPPQRSYCLITRQRAKYRDPATQAPFCNASTFRALRDVLALHLEQRPNNDPETLQWLEYKRKERQERQAAAQQLACKVRLTPSMQAVHALQAVQSQNNQAAASSA